MYALVSLCQLDETRPAESRARLERGVVLFVRQSPGFVGGFWTYERATGKSIGFALFDSVDHARDLRDVLERYIATQHEWAIQLEMNRVQEIVAHEPAEHDARRSSIHEPDRNEKGSGR